MVSKNTRIHYECEGRIEKSVLRDHRLSSFRKPRDAKRRTLEQIFLAYPHTHDKFLYYQGNRLGVSGPHNIMVNEVQKVLSILFDQKTLAQFENQASYVFKG